MRLFRLLLVALATSALAAPAVAPATTGDTVAQAAAKKKCKKGLVRNKKGKCVKPKKPAPKPAAPVVPAAPAAPADPAATPTPLPAADTTSTGVQKVRNDQALVDALKGNALYRAYSHGGYGTYAYNFLGDVASQAQGTTAYHLRYCTFYNAVGFGNSRDNYDGFWAVIEGYTFPDYPGLVGGAVEMYRSAMGQQTLKAKIALQGSRAELDVGDGSKYFEGGNYSVKPGRASKDCSQWETDG